jgi:Uncharacterised nucleotidyltransferase
MVHPEWRLLELVTLDLASDGDRTEFEEIIGNSHLNWGEVLDQALRHKVLHLLTDTVAARNCWASLPRFLSEHLRDLLRINRHRLRLYREAAADVTEALARRGLRVACTKGIALESTVYKGSGARYMVDIDFMIRPEDGEAATAVMQDLGYVPGYYDWRSGGIHTFTRRELIAYRLNPDHLPPFIRVIDDAIVPHLDADLACSLTWTQCEHQIDMADALSEVIHQPLPGLADRMIPVLTPHYHFIFTILHLFREAWKDEWLDLEQDVNLIKFADVVRLWRAHQETLMAPDFRTLLEHWGIVEPVGWVLVHLDRTFGTDLATRLGIDTRIGQEFLNSAGAPGGRARRMWRGSMRDRLQARRRRNLFAAP